MSKADETMNALIANNVRFKDDQISQLTAENQRLREALQAIARSDAGYTNCDDPDRPDMVSGHFADGYAQGRIDAANGAREALAALQPQTGEDERS